MPIQTQVELKPAQGIPGAKADMNTFDYYPQSLVANKPVTIGTFVWLDEDNGTQATYASSSVTSAPIGFVERNGIYPENTVNQDALFTVGQGQGLTIATKGAFYAVTTSNATAGQAVFALLADGTIATAKKGETVANAIETGFEVLTSGNAGETIIIKRS